MQQPVLIPAPTSAEFTGETTVLTPSAYVTGPGEWVAALPWLLGAGVGLVRDPAGPSRIEMSDDPDLGAEAYELQIAPGLVTIRASGYPGFAAAVATLRQLLPVASLGVAPVGELTLPCGRVTDEPRWSWRGQHLDVARHFQSVDTIRRLLDVMHLTKLNVLHLHLTDDQGWRLPVPGYDRLTEVGCWRTETQRPWDNHGDGTPVGGYYSVAELKSLVSYAAQRGITVVPEIDLPGHARALLAAYPEYGDGVARPVATTFGVFDEVLHPSVESMAMVTDVLRQVLDVFEAPIVHVGGDECPTVQWHESPAVQQFAKEQGIGGVEHLHAWFVAQLHQWLTSNGCRVAAWDEIVDADPERMLTDVLVTSWRGATATTAAAAAGYEVVDCNQEVFYFDAYAGTGDDEPAAIHGYTTWQDVLSYDPLAGLAAGSTLRGLQAQLWTEYAPTSAHVEYLLHPRQAAFAQLAWSGPGADVASFAGLLDTHFERLDALSCQYRPLTGPRPWQSGGTGHWRRPDHHVGVVKPASAIPPGQ